MGYLHLVKRPPTCVLAAERSLPLFRLAELRLGRVGVIYVDRSRVLGEKREPHAVGGLHRTASWVLVDVPDPEILEEAAPSASS